MDLIPALLRGLGITVLLAAAGIVLATILAVIAGSAKLSRAWFVRWPAIAYIEVFRGTSALIQLFWFYFVLPLFGIEMPAVVAGILVLGLNAGAYGAEIVRGGIQAVPRGQWDAATALGFTRAEALRRIVLPQAVLSMIPAMGNIYIELLKNTALVSLITISELTFTAQTLRADTLRTTEIFIIVLVLYFIVAQCISQGMRAMERRLSHGRDVVVRT